MSSTKKPVAIAVSAALATGLLLSGSAFASTHLAQGYLLGASTGDKAAEGKCGGAKAAEGKCGEGKCGGAKAAEGKCGGAKAAEGSCGMAQMDTDKDGKLSRAEFAAAHGGKDDGSPQAARRVSRPMRPKPLIPMRIVIFEMSRLGRNVVYGWSCRLSRSAPTLSGIGRAAGHRRTGVGITAAAVFGQKPEQRAHGVEIGAIADEATTRFGLDQSGRRQLLEMERQRGSGERQGFGDFARHAPFRPGLDQTAEHGQAGGLAEGGERGSGLLDFHESIIPE